MMGMKKRAGQDIETVRTGLLVGVMNECSNNTKKPRTQGADGHLEAAWHQMIKTNTWLKTLKPRKKKQER